MTCLIDRILDRAGMKSHASMLGTFFVYTLALCMPIFKKKSTLNRLGKRKSSFPQTFQGSFFLKIGIQIAKAGIYKKRPQHRSMRLHSCSVQNSVYQASHCSALLIGWLNICRYFWINVLLKCTYSIDSLHWTVFLIIIIAIFQ